MFINIIYEHRLAVIFEGLIDLQMQLADGSVAFIAIASELQYKLFMVYCNLINRRQV